MQSFCITDPLSLERQTLEPDALGSLTRSRTSAKLWNCSTRVSSFLNPDTPHTNDKDYMVAVECDVLPYSISDVSGVGILSAKNAIAWTG